MEPLGRVRVDDLALGLRVWGLGLFRCELYGCTGMVLWRV